MFTRVAQEITQLLADEYEPRPSATRRLAKARLVASIAEGLRHAQIVNMGVGLSDGSRAAFLDARLSLEERQQVVSALSCDPRDRAEMTSAAALLDCVDAEPSPLPQDLLAQAVTTFVKSAADQAPAVGGRRAWRRQALMALYGQGARRRQAVLVLMTSLAALILLMAVAPALLSPAGNESPATFAESTGSAGPAAQSSMTDFEPGAGDHAIDLTIFLPPEPVEGARSILARGETSAVSCDDGHEVAGHDHEAGEVGKAKDDVTPLSGATPEASCGSHAPTVDIRSTKPQARSDAPSLRIASSRQSNDFRLGMVVDSLYAIPDGVIEVADRAVSLFGQLGKKTLDLVDPRCIVGQLQMVSQKKSSKSLPRWCANHFPITFPVAQSRVENKARVQ